MDQIVALALWYVLIAALGWLSFPIAYRYLGALPDRGYSSARALGLLLWGFIFWLLSSYGLLLNNPGGLLTAVGLLAALAWWARRGLAPGEMRTWLRDKRSMLIAMELLFLLAFVFMAFVRASRPEINHTEQPMELAFINAILRSPSMPAHDPWLSGFSISYYYFGYLMMAMLAKLSGVIGSIAFNLGHITIFSTAALGAYGAAFNLLALYKPAAKRSMLWLASLAPLFVLLLGNVEGLLELAHARHLFWDPQTISAGRSGFWEWLDVQELSDPPSGEPRWAPRAYGTGSWWWWRASRVIHDRTYTGADQELIDEFPAFSFTLGDLHPHVLSMPFVMLAVGLALNVFLGGAERKEPLPLLGLQLRPESLLLTMVVLGGLAFLNIWDFPIYVGLFTLAYVLRYAHRSGWNWERFWETVRLGLTLLTGGILAYLPFYLTFTSQAAGILPNLLNPSRGVQLWIMFGTLWLPLCAYLLFRWRQERSLPRWLTNILYGLLFVAWFWALSVVLTWLYFLLFSQSELGLALAALGAPDLGVLLSTSLARRLAAAGGWVMLAVLLGSAFGLLVRLPAVQAKRPVAPTVNTFLVLLIFAGTLLVIAPEFVYLRDQFGTRMNTVFKFFFQAWQLWAVAAAVASVILLYELRRAARVLFVTLLALIIAIGLVFPLYSFSDITHNPVGSLDGASYLSPDVRQAIQWLQLAPLGTLVEAVGGSYDANFARFAAHSGQQGLMGWPGHEGQWRGGNVDWARLGDIQTLYSAPDWETARLLIEKYGVDYIVLGSSERSAYEISETKFIENLAVAFQNAEVTIYQVP
jgi:YYY domain-containing protein